jgi:hypothetical protein
MASLFVAINRLWQLTLSVKHEDVGSSILLLHSFRPQPYDVCAHQEYHTFLTTNHNGSNYDARAIDTTHISLQKIRSLYTTATTPLELMCNLKERKSMSGEAGVENGSDWKKFLGKHWSIVALFAVAGILLFVGAIYVCLWFVGDAQSTGLVPSTLGLWTMGHIVTFILHLIFWELIFIGVPTIVGAVAGWQWWSRLPVEEKKEYHFFGKRSRTTGGGGVSALLMIAFAIKVYIDGNWNVAISTWTLDYVVGSMITILIWMAVIFGIPISIAIVLWMRHEMHKKP